MRISDWSSDVCSSDLRLQERHGIVADEGGDGTQDNGAERPRIASRRCDRNQTRDNARTETKGRSLMSVKTHCDHPGKSRSRRGDKSVHHRKSGRAIGFERRTGIEAEPANPKQAGADACHGQAVRGHGLPGVADARSEEHTSELQSLMRISYAVFCLKKKKQSVYDLLSH